jgi:hypothetical protein
MLIVCSTNAAAGLARVEWFDRQCGGVLVRTDIGYAYAQQVSPGMLAQGDTLDGDFERDARAQTVKNTSSHTSLTLWVEKFSSDRKVVLESMPAHCKPDEASAAK